MSVILRIPPGEKKVARETLGETINGQRVIAQVETCRTGQVRLLVVIGIDLIWTQRYKDAKTALNVARHMVADQISAFAPAVAY